MKARTNRPVIGINSTYEQNAHRWYKIPVNYVRAVYEAGAFPLIFPCEPDIETLNTYLDAVDGMLFSGGDDYPPELYGQSPGEEAEYMDQHRAQTDLLLMKTVLGSRNMPVLGICAGHQLLAISTGATIIQHVKNPGLHGHHKETEHPVNIKGGKWLKSIFKAPLLVVNSYHHQAVDQDAFPSEYEISAFSEDGLVEAMEYRGKRFILGVQWHPERIQNALHKKLLFDFFIKKCTDFRNENERKVITE
jgi:putative glutamine amidotransferase